MVQFLQEQSSGLFCVVPHCKAVACIDIQLPAVIAGGMAGYLCNLVLRVLSLIMHLGLRIPRHGFTYTGKKHV